MMQKTGLSMKGCIMDKLHILGTGNAMVTKCYNTCFALSSGDNYFLVDTGGGNTILKNLKAMNIDISQLQHIFISHNHIDHILGVIWLIRAYSAHITKKGDVPSLTIYAHQEVCVIIKTMIEMLLNKKQSLCLDGKLFFEHIEDNKTYDILCWKITFFDIQSTKDLQFGFTTQTTDHKKLVFLGDEPYREQLYSIASKADYLLHEAFCLYHQRESFDPYKKHHVTVKDACENAALLEVKNVVLYHCEDKTYENRKSLYTEEGQAYFDGTILVPYDLEVIELV